MKINTVPLKAALAATVIGLTSQYCLAGKLEEAETLFHNGAYKSAIPAYQEALNDTSYSEEQKAEINYAIGTAFFLEGNITEAKQYFGAARSLNPRVNDGKTFRIPSPYMEPQLKVGDLIMVNTRYFQEKPVRRFDVVTFLNPQKPEYMYLMRVIGLPGERLEIKNKQVIINGKELSEPFSVNNKNAPPSPYDNHSPVVIPKNSYYLMADNRDNALDSREFGAVDQKFIRGKALVIYATERQDVPQRALSWERSGTLIK